MPFPAGYLMCLGAFCEFFLSHTSLCIVHCSKTDFSNSHDPQKITRPFCIFPFLAGLADFNQVDYNH